MIEMYIFTATALVVAGVTVGVLVTAPLGINGDDCRDGFPAETSDRLARAARRVTGAGALQPGTGPTRLATGRTSCPVSPTRALARREAA